MVKNHIQVIQTSRPSSIGRSEHTARTAWNTYCGTYVKSTQLAEIILAVKNQGLKGSDSWSISHSVIINIYIILLCLVSRVLVKTECISCLTNSTTAPWRQMQIYYTVLPYCREGFHIHTLRQMILFYKFIPCCKQESP